MATTVQPKLATAVQLLAAVEWLAQLTHLMATKQPASLARLPMATVADLIMRIVLLAALATPKRILKTAIAEASKAETREATLMTAVATVTTGAMAMTTTTVTTVHQAAVTESRADTPVAIAGMVPETATVKMMMMMTMMVPAALAAMTESRADTPVAIARMDLEVAAVKIMMMMMTTMVPAALAHHSTWPLSTT